MRVFVVMILLLAAQSIEAQVQLGKIRSYFRSDPFRTSFGTFVSHLVNDPDLSEKTMKRKSDTSLFYFSGTYSKFNPFFLTPKKLDVILEEIPVSLSDTLASDTIYAYELAAIVDDSDAGRKQIKKEFERVHKLAKSQFPSFKHSELENLENGEAYNYFSPHHELAPFTILKYEMPAEKAICLVLIMRLKPINNESRLPYGLLESN